MCRAAVYAVAALVALAVVYGRNAVHQFYCAFLTCALALAALNAAVLALLQDDSLVRVSVGAERQRTFLIFRNAQNKVLRTGGCTCAASCTLVCVEHRQTVFANADGAELTGSGTVAEADAAEVAHLGAVNAHCLCGGATLYAVVEAFRLSAFLTAAAGEDCAVFYGLYFNAEYGADLFCNFRTACSTSVCGRLACCTSGSKSVTSWVAAATAVCARKALADFFYSRINRNEENLFEKAQQNAKQKGEAC